MSELPPEALAPDLVAAPEVPAPADAALPPADRDLRSPGGSLGAVVVVACCALVLWQLNPAPAAAQHHRQRRRHGRPRLVPGLPAGPPAAALAGRGLVARLVRGLPGRASSTSRSRRCSSSSSTSSCRTTSRSSSSPRSARCCCRPAPTRSAGGCKVRRPGPELFAVAATLFLFFKGVAARPRARTTRRSSSTSGSWAGRSSARWRGSTRSRSRSRSGSRSSARSRSRCGPAPAVARRACCSPRRCMCHLVVGIFVVVGALDRLAVPPPGAHLHGSRPRSASVGALLTAFWTLPLLATFGYTANMRYEKLTWYLDYLFPTELWWVVRARR